MSVFQVILTSIATVFLTLGIFFLARSIFVFKKFDKYLFFALTSLFGGLFVFFEFMLSRETSDYLLLLYHRFRMYSLILCILSWFFCLYDMFLKIDKSLIIFTYFSIAICFTIPSNLFLSLPISYHETDFLGIKFTYHFGNSQIFYTIYALVMLTFAVLTIHKLVKSENARSNKILAIVTLLPMFSGINDFAVTHGLINSIFLSEYLTFFFVIAISIHFLKKKTFIILNWKTLTINLLITMNIFWN